MTKYQLMPSLTPDEYAALKADIASRGVQVPVEYDEAGNILDGHHRVQACRELGLPEWPKVIRVGMSEEQKAKHVITLNLARRHLNESQRAMIAVRLAVIPHGVRADRLDVPIGTSMTQPEAADMLNVSRRSVIRARQVLNEATPEVIQAIEQGKMTVSGAVTEMKAIQRQVERTAMAESVSVLQQTDKWKVTQADMQTYQTEHLFDFIITDPPYPREYLLLYEQLAIRAKDWLQPNGLLLAMCGESYLNEIMAMMEKHLEYYWTGCYLTPGQPTPLRNRQVNTIWKPVLIYGLPRSDYKGKIFSDVWRSDGNDKEHHHWGQSESGMLSIISQVCLPGQSIFDPFCGGGTTGVAALAHGCTFEGIDIDAESVGISRARLAGVK